MQEHPEEIIPLRNPKWSGILNFLAVGPILFKVFNDTLISDEQGRVICGLLLIRWCNKPVYLHRQRSHLSDFVFTASFLVTKKKQIILRILVVRFCCGWVYVDFTGELSWQISTCNFSGGGRTFAIYMFMWLELVVVQLSPLNNLPLSPLSI